MNGIVSRLSALGKVWLGLAAGALALIVFGLAAPGSGLFFPLLSLWCNAALFALALLVLRRAGVELDLFHKAVLVGVWAVAALYSFWALGSRTFLYYWDYVNYILKQYNAEAAFAQSTGAGFRFLLDSITEDYTNFIPLFTEFPFCLSGKTGDDYAFCQLFSVLPSLLVLLAGLVCKAGQLLRVKNTRWYFLIGFSWCVTFPFLRMSAMLGQPDWFGLIFAFMLLLLTLDYRFDRIDLPRCLLIFAATAGVILTRRWYLYFVVGYCFAYVLLLVVSSVQLAKSGQQSRAVHRLVRLAVFGLCAAGAMVLLLLPMVRKILGFDYAGRYSYYNFGGITLELAAQTLRIGLLNFILIGLGLWFAVKRRLPALPCGGRAAHEPSAVHPGTEHRFPPDAAVRAGVAAAVPHRFCRTGRGHPEAPEAQAFLLGLHAGVCHVGALFPADHRGPAGFCGGPLSPQGGVGVRPAGQAHLRPHRRRPDPARGRLDRCPLRCGKGRVRLHDPPRHAV